MPTPARASPRPEIPILEDYAHQVDRDIRFFDLDGVGHVNHAAVARYLEEGRLTYLDGINDPIKADPVFMLAHIAIDYLAQLHWPGTVTVGTRIARFGRSSVHWDQAVFHDGACAARARAVMVLADRTREASVPIPDHLRVQLTERGAGPRQRS